MRTDDVDLDRGLRRARAATLFTLSLPGSAYLYQGEELGLPEVTDLPPEARQDPAWHRSGGTDGTRDGCRVPIPWSGDAPSYGFGPGGSSWLPQPEQLGGPVRREPVGRRGVHAGDVPRGAADPAVRPALGDGPLEWLTHMGDVLAIRRSADDGTSVVSIINLNNGVVRLPADWGSELLVASSDDVAVVSTDESGAFLAVGAETAVWLKA